MLKCTKCGGRAISRNPITLEPRCGNAQCVGKGKRT